jgi:hypothetical protein
MYDKPCQAVWTKAYADSFMPSKVNGVGYCRLGLHILSVGRSIAVSGRGLGAITFLSRISAGINASSSTLAKELRRVIVVCSSPSHWTGGI